MRIVEMLKETYGTDKPINEFVKKTYRKVKRWVKEDKLCIVSLLPDGVFYGKGLYDKLCEELGEDRVEITYMDREGKGLGKKKLQEAKVLLVDNDIITSQTYRMAMHLLESLREKLQIKDIKYSVFEDRTTLADFAGRAYINYMDKYEASRRLHIHPEAFTRLCRESKIPGAVRTDQGWRVEKQSLEAFAKTYNPVSGPRKEKE